MGKKMLRVKVRRTGDSYAPSDLGTPEIEARRETAVESIHGNHRRRRVITQVPLDLYRNMKRGGITQRQWEAGNLLFEKFTAAGLLPSMAPLLGTIRIPSIAGQKHSSHSQQAAYADYSSILDKLGRERYGTALLVNVCCYGYLLADVLEPPYATTAHLMSRFKEALTELANILYLPHYPEQDDDARCARQTATQKKNIAK